MQLKGRRVMVVADEDVAKLRPSPPAFAWVYDITDERQPLPVATFDVPGLDPDGVPQPAMTGCHHPAERFAGMVVPFAWFAQGLRLCDLADPFNPREVGFFEPDVPPGCARLSSNDVTVDGRGIAYLTDRQRGLDIIECSVSAYLCARPDVSPAIAAKVEAGELGLKTGNGMYTYAPGETDALRARRAALPVAKRLALTSRPCAGRWRHSSSARSPTRLPAH